MKILHVALGLTLGLGLPAVSAAQAPGSAAGLALRASTLGGGIEVATTLMPNLNLRLGANGASYSYDTDYSGNDYEFDLSLQSFSALADYHLVGGGFRLSGGLMLNGNGLDIVGRPGSSADILTFSIGDQVYDATTEVQAFTGEIEFPSLAPYAGIGWGNMIGDDKKWGLMLDIGFVLQGSPTVTMGTVDTLDDTTPIPGDAQGRTAKQILLDNVKTEEAELEDDISTFDLYPLISIGVSYRFL